MQEVVSRVQMYCPLARCLAAGLAIAVVATGCQKTVVDDRPSPFIRQPGDSPIISVPDTPTPTNVLEEGDVCANRMHDLSGLFLLYMGVNKRLPTALEDLKTVALSDQKFSTICPNSGQPFIYVPQAPVTSEGQLVVYAPVASPGGRMAIYIRPSRGSRAAWAGAKRISEHDLQLYLSTLPRPATTQPTGS